jgi:glycosyltransferase involved in cell wall biosynthesis
MGASVRRVPDREPPSFDLVVATVDRVEELRRLFASLEHQTHPAFRILLVDQNDDDRLDPALQEYRSLNILRLRSRRGLSRARNVALGHLDADVAAFPDDDCVFRGDLLERVARRFATEPGLDGLTGRAEGERGQSSASWAGDAAVLTRTNLWNRAISFTIFLRAPLVSRVGDFDEGLGLGSDRPWSSGEEIDYLVRAVDAGARIEYDPTLVVVHEEKTLSPDALRRIGARDGASIGYLLRKHGYPAPTVGKMLVRPVGGALLALARRDPARAAFHLSTLRGRLRGYRAA